MYIALLSDKTDTPNNMANSKFTIEEGLKVQEQHLKDYRIILNDMAYGLLMAECIKRNGWLSPANGFTGYDVFRGTDMLNFLLNIKNNY